MNELNLTTPSLLFSAISLILLAYTNRFLSYASVVRTLNERYQENPDKDPTTLGQIRNFVLRLRLIRAMQTFGAISLLLCLTSMFFFSIHINVVAEIIFGIGMVSLAASLALCIWEIQISTEAIGMHLQNIRRRQREQDPYLGNSLRRNANRREGETLGEQNTRKNQEKQRKEKQDREERKAQERAEREAAQEQEAEERTTKQRPERQERKEKVERQEKPERKEKQEKRERVELPDTEAKVEKNDKQEQLSKQEKRERFEQQREERRRERQLRREREENTEATAEQEVQAPRANVDSKPRQEPSAPPSPLAVENKTQESENSQDNTPARREQSARPISRRANPQRVEPSESKPQQEEVKEEATLREPSPRKEVKEPQQPMPAQQAPLTPEEKPNPVEGQRERKIFAHRKAKAEQSEAVQVQEERKSRYQQRQLARQSETK